MPDITADSPVADLWPDGEGGLTGARALARLGSVPVRTIGELLEMDAADITDIPRARKGVLAEVRRALTARGLHLAGDRAPSPAAIGAARKTGQAEAQRAAKRTRAQREDPPPASAEDFAALAADLRTELDESDDGRRRRLLAIPRLETPRAFTGRPWAWHPVGPAGASTLTGYSAATIRAYAARSEREHAAGKASERTMPPPRDGRWVTGDLAVWVATRNEGQAVGYEAGPKGQREERRTAELIPATLEAAAKVAAADGQVTFLGLARELGLDYRSAVHRAAVAGVESALARESAGDAEVAAFLSNQLAATRRYQTTPSLLDALHEAGIPATSTQVRRLLPDLRAAELRRTHRPSGTERARGESLHPNGWLAVNQVAEDYGVTPGAISAAVKRGEIRVARRSHGRTWIDPGRLRARKDARRTPVDVSHPIARLEPGDAGFEG